MKIGRRVQESRWLVLAGWLAAALALGLLVPGLDPAANEPDNFLPESSDQVRAVRALAACFPQVSGLGEAVVVFERAGGELSADDLDAIEDVAGQIGRADLSGAPKADLAGVKVRSPASFLLPANPLVSPDGRAASILVNVPANFVTVRSARVVEHIRRVVASRRLPEGLLASVTGSSGFGHDYAEAAQRGHERIGYVTLVAVVVILLLVYRAPLAALVPLAAISTAAFVAMRLLGIAQHFGMHVGTGERVFCFVLIYGAGMDYSLLLISRCREFLDAGAPAGEAAARGLGATFAAILASAGTDTVGLLMLCAAEYGVFRTAGPAIAAALVVALLAAVTLVPAMIALLGRALFWPGGRMGQIGRRWLWPRVAQRVTARPGLALAATVVLMAVPAVQALRLTWVYDALAGIRPEAPGGVGNAAVGIDAAKRHWPIGQIAPVTVLLRNETPLTVEQWQSAAGRLTAALAGVRGVCDVRSLSQPLGREGLRLGVQGPRRSQPAASGQAPAAGLDRLLGGLKGLASDALRAAVLQRARAEYVSADRRAMRAAVILDQPALTLKAMADVGRIRRSAAEAAQAAGLHAAVHVAGATAEMIDIRSVTRADFHRVAALVLGIIFLMVLALLRDWVLSAFLVAATVLSYLATLGLSYWGFAAAGAEGLDWKVEVFLFVVMVAVGVDYSIFLAARVSQEARGTSVAEAVRRAVIHTGPVISSCGVIMAATLGSLMAGELKLFEQLGVALALGMLIDTFVVRPLLLPAFIALTGHTGKIPKALE
jgi:RND superfamily putative drug exporter